MLMDCRTRGALLVLVQWKWSQIWKPEMLSCQLWSQSLRSRHQKLCRYISPSHQVTTAVVPCVSGADLKTKERISGHFHTGLFRSKYFVFNPGLIVNCVWGLFMRCNAGSIVSVTLFSWTNKVLNKVWEIMFPSLDFSTSDAAHEEFALAIISSC